MKGYGFCMEKKRIANRVIRFLFAMVVGVFVATCASQAVSVKAAETEQVVTIADEDTATAAEAENAGSSVFLLLGGMLLIIITVVITVVASVVVTAPIADEV